MSAIHAFIKSLMRKCFQKRYDCARQASRLNSASQHYSAGTCLAYRSVIEPEAKKRVKRASLQKPLAARQLLGESFRNCFCSSST